MLTIQITLNTITFGRYDVATKEQTRRVYPYTPALHDQLQRALDARAASALVQYEDHVRYTPRPTRFVDGAAWRVYPHQHKRLLASGTAVDERADPALVRALESARIAHREYRVKLTFDDAGDPGCSQSGYVGRTTGNLKELILCSNARSLGGDLISLDRVRRVEYANQRRGGVIWERPA